MSPAPSSFERLLRTEENTEVNSLSKRKIANAYRVLRSSRVSLAALQPILDSSAMSVASASAFSKGNDAVRLEV